MKKITKLLVFSIVFSIVTTFSTSGFVEAKEQQPTESEIKNDKYICNLTQEELNEYKNIINDDSEESVTTPRVLPAIPFLASAVFGILAKQGVKTAIKSISKHALQRAGQRGITKQQFANAIKNGTKYTDTKTGAKILYDKKSGTALVIKGNKVITSYKQKNPKKKWRKGH